MHTPDAVFILSAAAAVLLVLLAAFAWAARRPAPPPNPSARRMWSDVAGRLGGKPFHTEGGDFRVRFRWNGRQAALYQGPPVAFEIEDGDFGDLELKLTGELNQGFDFEDILCLASTRDRREAAAAFLSPPVRRLLEDVWQLSEKDARVRIGRGLRVQARLRMEPDRLVRFAVLCLQLAQHARLFSQRDGGIRVVEAASSSVGQCQICGTGLEGRLVRCVRCSTPHHADCWTYSGACSTYGCGEKSFVA